MNILIATPRFFPELGGVETHVFQTGKRLVLQGHVVKVLTTDRSGKLPINEVLEGINIHRIPAWPRNSDFYFAPGIYREILKEGWDILHIQSYHTFVPPFAMLAALRLQKPYVLTFHGGGHSSSLRHAVRKFQRFLLRPLLARAKKLIAVARFEIDQFSYELKLPREQFTLIPNGVEFPRIKLQHDNKHGEKEVIASVGRLEKYKGHHRIIAAMPHVLKRKPNLRLWIAGSGPYKEDLQKLAARLGVESKVDFRSYPPEARHIFAEDLSNASLFVLFSEYETHPLAALEAISLGCPALVADTSGLREIAEDGLAYSLPLDCSDEQLAQGILEQLDNPLPIKQIKLPTWDDCTTGLLALYQDIVGA